jgi:hypothetical protein
MSTPNNPAALSPAAVDHLVFTTIARLVATEHAERAGADPAVLAALASGEHDDAAADILRIVAADAHTTRGMARWCRRAAVALAPDV